MHGEQNRSGTKLRFAMPKQSSVSKTAADSKDVRADNSHVIVKDYAKIESSIGYKFADRSWLEHALTHRSAPQDGERKDYERLEFLGDAVFDLAVAHLLSDRYPEATEGELSKMRAALVNTSSLAKIASQIQLGPYIRLGRSEISSGGAERPSILADVLESVIGAVYRDAGFEKALGVVETLFKQEVEQVVPRDPKTELQEALHAIGSEAPKYLLECVEGPEHAPTFVTVVEVDGEIVGRGRGATKKASQQLAASEALAKLQGEKTQEDKTQPAAPKNNTSQNE